MHDRQKLANVVCSMLVRPLPEDLLPAAHVNAAVFQRSRAAGTGRVHTIAFSHRWMGRKQPLPAGNRFSNLGGILPLEGLFGRRTAGKGFVLRTGEALHLRGAFFPTGENSGLAPFPNHIELCFLDHFNSCAMASISTSKAGSLSGDRFSWKSTVIPSSST